MLGGTCMDDERFEAPWPGARCNRRDALRWLGGSTLAIAGIRNWTEKAGANPAPSAYPPAESHIPAGMTDVSHDTRRAAGLGFAAAAVLVAGKLIRDKERDPEL